MAELHPVHPLAPMPLVLIESPFAAYTLEGIEENLHYLRACMRDCLLRGEAPYASHALYTQPGVLADTVHDERQLGMEAGWAFLPVVGYVVVYTDRGISSGMDKGVLRARALKKRIEYRTLGGEWA